MFSDQTKNFTHVPIILEYMNQGSVAYAYLLISFINCIKTISKENSLKVN